MNILGHKPLKHKSFRLIAMTGDFLKYIIIEVEQHQTVEAGSAGNVVVIPWNGSHLAGGTVRHQGITI